jgi:hypothetical protein
VFVLEKRESVEDALMILELMEMPALALTRFVKQQKMFSQLLYSCFFAPFANIMKISLRVFQLAKFFSLV